jgi:pimeloyl-ACP methyl ester carboxylesterase
MTRSATGGLHHRHVAANGARFHVVEAAGAGPLVLLLHGFPETWEAWRSALPTLAGAGFRAVAMDLRGYGASDKTPRGYDPATLSADVAGVIRTLGFRDAVLVGHGWGGYVAWAAAALRPDCVRALCAVAAPHPLRMLRSAYRHPSAPAIRHLLAMQMPWLPERRIRQARYIERHLTSWSAPGSTFPAPDVVARYREALASWPSPHCALEYHRWLLRSRIRADGRAFTAAMRSPLDVPVLLITGALDVAVPQSAVTTTGSAVAGPYRHEELAGAGHFPHEEQPELFLAGLMKWLSAGTGTGFDSSR